MALEIFLVCYLEFYILLCILSDPVAKKLNPITAYILILEFTMIDLHSICKFKHSNF